MLMKWLDENVIFFGEEIPLLFSGLCLCVPSCHVGEAEK